MPALVKAFLEQVMRPGTAFAYQSRGFPKKLLTGRSARLIVTMGMPAPAYRFFYLGHALRALKRNILNFVGIRPVRESLYGMVTEAKEDTRKAWLDEVRALGGRLG
jgi:putative NADPH-quinone reductase